MPVARWDAQSVGGVIAMPGAGGNHLGQHHWGGGLMRENLFKTIQVARDLENDDSLQNSED
ncbi:MAG: hypothetical protein QNK82_10205 [Akkermansiaceae bacterium]